jgi:hypothetical protein
MTIAQHGQSQDIGLAATQKNLYSIAMKSSLDLCAHRSSWSVSAHHGTELDRSNTMQRLRPKILVRDDYICQGCGLKAPRWQEIHHRNHDHKDFKESNLETRCALCHQVAHLHLAATSSGGKIIWLPEVTQAALNRMCVFLFIGLRHPDWRPTSEGLLSGLKTREAFMIDQFSTSDPASLAEVLLSLPNGGEGHASIAPLRLLPSPSRFETQVNYWEKDVLKSMSPEKWDSMLPDDFDLSSILASRPPKHPPNKEESDHAASAQQ